MGFLKALTEPFRRQKQHEPRLSTREISGLVRRFWPFLRPWRGYGVLAVVLLLITVLFQLPMPLITRYVIDDVFPNRDARLLNWIVLGFGALMFFRVASGLLSNYCLTIFRQNVLLRIQVRLFAHVERLSLAFHNNAKVGYLMTRIGSDPQNLRGLMAETFFNLMRNLITFIAGMAILFYLHWRLALVALCVLPVFVFTVKYFSGKVRRRAGEVQENIGRVFDIMGESLYGIHAIKSLGAEGTRADVLHDRYRASFRTNLQFAMVNAVYSSLTGLISGIGPLIILAYGGREVMTGNLSLGSFVAFNGYIGYLYGPVQSLMGLNANVQAAFASLGRIFELFDMQTEDDALDGPAVPLPPLKGRVRYDNVTFSYNGGKSALEQVSFDAKPGQKVALVGRSGAGKSTIVNLMMKFYTPSEGGVFIDDVDVRAVRATDVRRDIGIVLQDPFLFGGSVRDNLKLGRPRATDAEIEAAARAAYAHDFISNLPDGYDTEIGERGVKLSGGERKRLAIARAMLKNPRILILDEATSEVDTKSERLIQEALAKLRDGKTTFVIAHRLSTIRDADKILLLDDGRVVDEGNHGELYGRSTLYRTLCDEKDWPSELGVA